MLSELANANAKVTLRIANSRPTGSLDCSRHIVSRMRTSAGILAISITIWFITFNADSGRRALRFRVVLPSVRPLTPVPRDAMSLHVVEKSQLNWARIFVMWLGTTEKVFKVMMSNTLPNWEMNWLSFQSDRFKGQGHRNVRRRRHNDRLLR